MAADSLGPIDLDLTASLEAMQRTAPVQPADAPASLDPTTAERVAAELDAAMQAADGNPEVRADRVADVKSRLEDPDYLNDRVIDRIAERLQKPFGT